MTDTEPPIDPTECDLRFERASGCHATLRARVPASLVRRFRKKMRRAGRDAELAEVKSELLRFLCAHVAEREGVRFGSAPLVRRGAREPRLSLDQDFVLDLEFDLNPELERPESLDLELLEPDAPVTDELVDAEMRNQCLQVGRRAAADAGGAPCEVRAACELRLAPDERPIATVADTMLPILSEGAPVPVFGGLFEGVAERLAGVRTDEEVVVETSVPDTFPQAPLRGMAAFIRISVRSIEAIEPATVEAVLEQYGSASEARLRNQIRFALEQRRIEQVKQTLRAQVAAKLPSLYAIDLPATRARMNLTRAEAEFRGVCRARGWNDDRADAAWAEVREAQAARAEASARSRTILQALPLREDVQVGDAALQERMASLAAERGMRPEEFRAALLKSGRFEEFTEQVLTESILDALVRKARVRKVPLDEWARLVQEPAAGVSEA